MKMEFTVADPLTKLWKEIEDIEALSIVSGSPYTHYQLVNIYLHVIKSTHDIKRVINYWYTLPAVDQT